MRPALRCVCAWASLGCKCLFASVGEALALACCVGMGRCMRGEGRAKGPEIQARHRLVPAVGIMRLVAGQARLLRQWSFVCIGVTNVCLCVWFALLVAWHGCGMRPALRCVCGVGFTSL